MYIILNLEDFFKINVDTYFCMQLYLCLFSSNNAVKQLLSKLNLSTK